MSLAIAGAISKAIAPLTGGVGKELSAYLGDQIRFLRWKSAVKILNRAEEFCKQQKVSPKQVPIKFIVPFLEAASFEDVDADKVLADMWAALFVSAVSSYQARHAIYIDILKKLATEDADFLQRLHKKIFSDDLYSDHGGFDPDMWNINDKHDQIDWFCSAFEEQGAFILEVYRNRGFPIPGPKDPFHRIMKKCVSTSYRLDIIPLTYDLGLYQEDGWTNGTGGLFIEPHGDLSSIFNLVSLNLMEKFDAVAWYPGRHTEGQWAARATCSFGVLTSLGFDFMKACTPPTKKRRQKKKA